MNALSQNVNGVNDAVVSGLDPLLVCADEDVEEERTSHTPEEEVRQVPNWEDVGVLHNYIEVVERCEKGSDFVSLVKKLAISKSVEGFGHSCGRMLKVLLILFHMCCNFCLYFLKSLLVDIGTLIQRSRFPSAP